MEQRPDSIPRGLPRLKTSSLNTSVASFGISLAAGGVLFSIFSLVYTQKYSQYLIPKLLTFIGIETCLLTALYRLTLHSLAKYPGPIWAAVTDWYNIYYCLSGYRHILFYDLHQQYGPIVRYGPNRISINTSTALKDIYGVQANTQKSKVYSSYDHFFEVPSSVTTINKKAHAFKRRINVRALSVQHVKESEELIYKNFRKLCSYLVDEDAKRGWSEGKDMAKMFSYMMSDIMGDVTFSRNWNVQDSEKNRYILDLLAIGACLINLAGHMPMLLKLKLHTIFFRKLMQGTYELKDLSKEQSDWRISQGDSLPHRDLFGALIDARDPETGQRLSNEDLVAEAGIYIVAGTDTTTTSLTSTLFYLLHYPSILERLQKDIRFMFADVEDIKVGTNLQSYRYLFACIDEAMRLSPGVGAVLPREVLPGGLMVDGTFFPEGVDVAVPCYSLHHHEDHYNDPFTYDPSRWLAEEGTPEDEVTRAQAAFCPFGVGRTSCAGKNLAYQEMAIVISRLVWLFDMRLKPGSRLGEGYVGLGKGRERMKEFQTRDWFVATQDGPIVEFRYRR